MNKLKAYGLTVLLSTFTFIQASQAATIAPPLEEQVQETAQWFIGVFNNAQQVTSNPSVPFISMSNCGVQLDSNASSNEIQNVYLEQRGAIARQRLYSFSRGISAVELSVRSLVNPDILNGICGEPESQRIVNTSNLLATSCNLEILWEPSRYVGTNAPNGCPTSTGGKVVSNIVFWQTGIDSLDQIFDARGNLIVNTPIQFRRVYTIPEQSYTLGLIGFAISYVGLRHRRKQKQRLTQGQKTFI